MSSVQISKLRKESVYLASHENFVSDVVMNLDVPAGDLLIVIDTNIFLSHLPFLNKLLECDLLRKYFYKVTKISVI